MSATLNHITFDCADAERIADFWSSVLDEPVDDGASPDFATITSRTSASWMFVKVPEPKRVKNRVHVDLGTQDLAAELVRLAGLGATHIADLDEGGTRWTTLADPEGNEFDVVQTGS
jgi:catechol 2,3-dioxygenase-like lactoylglutathione lyase family enzyme